MTDSEKLKIALILLSKANRVRYAAIIKLLEEQAQRKSVITARLETSPPPESNYRQKYGRKHL